MRFALFVLVALFSAGCSAPFPQPGQFTTETQRKITGWDEQNYFVDAAGERFFPWGFNYTHPRKVGLIDDDLFSEQAWQIIAQDFAEMRAYSANIVRVHLQYNRFMRDPVTPDGAAFAMLDRLVDIAESNGLYLLITGLGAYRKSDSPSWYDTLSTEERWRTQALFWSTLAARVGHREAVFAYDLMNEPVVSACPPDGTPCSWQFGQPLGGLYFVQNISIEAGRPFRATMSAWIDELTAAIRGVDDTTLITVGLLSNVPLPLFEEHLDFVSAHIYPRCDQLKEATRYLRRAGSRRPLVISETFNLFCDVDALQLVVEAVSHRLRGIIGHYDGQTPEELSDSDHPADWLRLQFLEYFSANPPAPVRGAATPTRSSP